MKRPILFLPFLLLAVLLCSPLASAAGVSSLEVSIYDVQSSHYVNRSVTSAHITLDGAPLDSDLPAFLYQSRTMAPVRLLAERLGATVTWDESARQVHIQSGSKETVLTIGSPTALVNGTATPLPDGVSAMMASYQGVFRTMVPLRFVSEFLGGQVSWDGDSYTAVVTSPTSVQPGFLVTDIEADDNAQTVFIATQGAPTYLLLDFGDRAVVDLPGGLLVSGMPATISMENEIFSAVRYAGHTGLYSGYASSVRVVLDLRSGYTCTDNVSVQAVAGGVLIQTARDSEDTLVLPSTPIDPGASTIVLDAGHGGSARGAQYEGVAEKIINLSVTLKLAQILKDEGYNVVLTRTGDESVGLYERAEIANRLSADIFVSLHSNAAPSVPDYTGIYTYRFPESRRGSLLAQFVQSSLVSSTGAVDRGIKSADFVVLRETDMAAVLVEMGFMTNHGELTQLMDSGYQDKLAQGIAQGIIRYLNSQK